MADPRMNQTAENGPWMDFKNGGGGVEDGPWMDYQPTKPAATTQQTVDPPARPGFFKRLGQSFGLATSAKDIAAADTEVGLREHPENLIPIVGAAKLAYGLGKSVVEKAKTAYGEAREAQQNIAAGGPESANRAKIMFAGLPEIAQGYGEDINSKNYAGAGGTATGVLIQAALSKAPKGLSRIKDGLTVSEDLQKAAAAGATQRTVPEIHAAALPELSSRAATELDKVAAQLGVDTTNTAKLSVKAELAGRGAKAAGQRIYAELDKAAAEVAGAPGGRFQNYAKTVQQLERESVDPKLTATEQEAVAERLNNAKAEYDAFKQEMIKRGLSEQAIKQADRFWAQGSALDEVSRGLLNAEDAFGNLKPNARPLDAAVKKFTAPASPRGHILKQATGDSADVISDAVRRAHERIATDKAATAAAKRSAAVAQERIDVIKSRQKKLGYSAAAAVLGTGAITKYGSDARDILSGK